MFGDMMEKLQAMKQQTEDAKKRLDNIVVIGESPGGDILVEMTGNKKLKQISIKKDPSEFDREELEDLLAIAVTKAIEQAENVFESEMKSVAMGMLPPM